MIELIAEIVCSPNRKEIYDKKVIFLTNSILDDIHFDETIYSGIDDSHDFGMMCLQNQRQVFLSLF